MLNEQQYEKLLEGINPKRVSQRQGGGGKSLSYVEVWDIKAHLTRIFGFGGWSWEVTQTDFAFEEKEGNRWSVGYRALGTLTIHVLNVKFAEAAVGSAMGARGDAHDNAIKNAESDALKRAAINLGDQFGLSLYRNGSTAPVVGQTMDRDTVSQIHEPPVEASETVADSDGAKEWIDSMKEAIDSKDVTALLNIQKAMNKDGVAENVYQGVTLAKWLDKAIAAVGKEKK